MIPFKAFDKIPRLNRTTIVTEKLDGTNAQICIHTEDTAGPEFWEWDDLLKDPGTIVYEHKDGKKFAILAGSRNRWLSHKADNYGFWHWVDYNKAELFKLGPGEHYGEWWGVGIQRGYGLTEKRFSLFNATRWTGDACPACCHVVPVISIMDSFDAVTLALDRLRIGGSVAAPGFMDPEGIVVYHRGADKLFKVTLKDDGKPKGSKEE